AGCDLVVVDRILEPVRQRCVGNLELDVEEKCLAAHAFLVGHAVAPENFESVQLDEDHAPTTAAATVSASTCGRTSCTRRIVAPRSYAATAAATLAATGPVFAVGSPRIRPSELLREKPTSTGRPRPVKTSSRRTS